VYLVELMNGSIKTNDANMIIGIDFDNTIIDYTNLFYEAGLSLGVLPDNAGCNKITIREYLIENERKQDWIKIQGLVYGEYIRTAKVMDGFSSFSDLCYENGWKIYIISHKTRDSIVGEKFNLHTSALHWLEDNRIYGTGIRGSVKGVFFESTRSDKVCRINQIGCNILIDDLAEVLLHPALVPDIIKILYDPDTNTSVNPHYYTASGWKQICGIIKRLYG
jgi:hypothetical protein